MRIQRHYTTAGQDPYAKVPFRSATSEIRNPDGSVVFKLDAFDVPSEWSQVAADVLAQKYFRRAGIPSRLKSFEENDVPSWLWRKVPDTTALDALLSFNPIPTVGAQNLERGFREWFDPTLLPPFETISKYFQLSFSSLSSSGVSPGVRLHFK